MNKLESVSHPREIEGELDMRFGFRCLLAVVVCGFSFLQTVGQASCPARPSPGSVVQDALSLTSQNGVLGAELVMGLSVDEFGYTHYCYNYKSPTGDVEAPTLRLNQGDTLQLHVVDRIQGSDSRGMKMHSVPGQICGDTGTPTLQSTNVHFHGLNVSPNCHEDDVLTTLIQPGTGGFGFQIPIPKDEPPGLYWYHPHIHGFTEFHV